MTRDSLKEAYLAIYELIAYLENRSAIYVIKKLKAIDANRPA
jgi:hypothetical protein